MYREVYNLKDDETLPFCQEASLSQDRSVGLKIENGLLFGSDRWFAAVDNGSIQKHTIKGHISRVYMGGHNDFAEYEVTDEFGIKTIWARTWTVEDAFVEGRGVEIIYVVQKFKNGDEDKCVIQINVDW